MKALLLALTLQLSRHCITASPLPTLGLRLRGGGLTKDEIIEKLNRVPTFAVVNNDGIVVPMTAADGSADVCWFLDPEEAKETLALTLTSHPEAEGHLRLACSPLGVVFEMCNGFPEAEAGQDAEEEGSPKYLGGTLRLVGPRESGSGSNEAALREQQKAQGIEPGAWVLATCCHDDFQTETIMPIFFSQDGFVAGWTRSGKPADSVPENLAVMDLRVLVKQMRDSDVFNWKIFTFVTTPAAYALAQELTEQARREKEGAEGDSDGSGAGGGQEEDES